MAEMAIGEAREVIVDGIHETRLAVISGLGIETTLEQAGLLGPEGSVAYLRETAAMTTSPKWKPWHMAIARVFQDVELAEDLIGGLDLGPAELRRISPVLPNPRYKPVLEQHDKRHPSTVFSGESRYSFFDQSTLRVLPGRHRLREYPAGLGGLAVVVRFREHSGIGSHVESFAERQAYLDACQRADSYMNSGW
jgi:hypothetical protein